MTQSFRGSYLTVLISLIAGNQQTEHIQFEPLYFYPCRLWVVDNARSPDA